MLYFNMYVFFLLEFFFSNLHFDRIDNTLACLRERGKLFDAGAHSKNSNIAWFLTKIRCVIWFMVLRYLFSFVASTYDTLAAQKYYISCY